MPNLPTWLTRVSIDITDDRAAEGIRPATLTAYLTAHGWTKTHDRHVAQWWRHPDMPERQTALVPCNENAVDYQRCVVNLARTIARHEERSILAILHDLHTVTRPQPRKGIPARAQR